MTKYFIHLLLLTFLQSLLFAQSTSKDFNVPSGKNKIRESSFRFAPLSSSGNQNIQKEHVYNPVDSLIIPPVKITGKNMEVMIKYRIVNDLFNPTQSQILGNGDSIQIWFTRNDSSYILKDVINANNHVASFGYDQKYYDLNDYHNTSVKIKFVFYRASTNYTFDIDYIEIKDAYAPDMFDEVSQPSDVAFPNPAKEYVDIYLSDNVAAEKTELLNIAGNILDYNWIGPYNSNSFDVYFYSDGIYFIRVTGEDYCLLKNIFVYSDDPFEFFR